MVSSVLGVVVGVGLTLAVFGVAYWDGRRVGIRRPLLWAVVATAPVAVGCYLYVFVPTAPITGVLLTANTGIVLYGFEREVVTDPEEGAEPGTLPHQK